MDAAGLIRENTERLPLEMQRQVLDFVEYLETRNRAEDESWSFLSLTGALAGMEEEDWTDVGPEDLVERWK